MCKVFMNEQLNGIELEFGSKPSSEVLSEVKSAGFHWNNKKKVWYAKKTDSSLAFADSVKELEKKHPAIVDDVRISGEDMSIFSELLDMVNRYDIAGLKARLEELVANSVKEEKPTEIEVVQDKVVDDAKPTAKGGKKSDSISRTDKAIINRLVKSGKNEEMAKAHPCKFGFCFSNGYYALYSDSDMGLPTTDSNELFDKLLNESEKCSVPVKIDMDDLNTLIKAKADKYLIAVDDKTTVSMNPKFVKDCLTWCGSDSILLNPEHMGNGCYKNPFAIVGNRKAMCCPVKC